MSTSHARTSNANTAPIDRFTAEKVSGTRHAFRNWYYTLAQISWQPNGPSHPVCIDAGCTMTIVDRSFLPPYAVIQKMTSSVKIRGLESKIHHSDEYAVPEFFMTGF